jgi:hypothetical protein
MPITGGCLCRKVRYQIAGEAPLGARQCWCRVCQYLSAGGGTVNAIFRKDAVTVTGETTVYTSVADSGSVMRRSFCPACGTPVFSEAEPRPHLIIVRVGTFDDPELGRPSAVVWTRAAPNWACFDPGLPQTDGQPAPAV